MCNQAVFGIDIGGTTIKCGLFSTSGALLQKECLATRTESGGAHILEDLRAYILKTLDRENMTRSEVAGIGLGVPGSVTPDGVVNKCVNLGWGVRPVALELASLLELSPSLIKVGNDAGLAALGESWKGSGKGCHSLLFVTVGTGVGGGLILDGKLVNGQHGAAAELGHLPIVEGLTWPCTCGKTGCLEQVASAPGIVRLARRTPGLSGVASAKAVFDAAKSGNAQAEAVVETVSCYLARGLACAAGIADPECFIIGGGVSGAGDYFIDRIRRHYSAQVFHPARETKIIRAALGNDAGMYGAAKLVLEM